MSVVLRGELGNGWSNSGSLCDVLKSHGHLSWLTGVGGRESRHLLAHPQPLACPDHPTRAR
jgi:hypothetical protein